LLTDDPSPRMLISDIPMPNSSLPKRQFSAAPISLSY
jgi:hypothetical protein